MLDNPDPRKIELLPTTDEEETSKYLSAAISSYEHIEILSFEVKETAQERIERKIDELVKKVATKEDVLQQTEILLKNQKQLNAELQKKLHILREMQEANVPHKRLARYSTIFLVFFLGAFLSETILNVTIITRLWNNIGILFSFGFFVMALRMKKDWEGNFQDK